MSLLALHYHFHVQTHRTDARTLIMNTFLAPFSCDAAHVAHKHRSMHILATYAAPPCLPHNAVRSSARVTRADAAPPLRDHHSGRACSPTAARHISSEAHGAARATRPLTAAAAARRRPRRAAGAAHTCRGSILRTWAPPAARTSIIGALATAANTSRHAAISIAAARVRGCGAAVGLGAHSELSFARKLSWAPELGIGHDVGNRSVLPLKDSSSATDGDHTTKVNHICAGGGHTSPKWGCKVPVACGCAPRMWRALLVRAPCSGALARSHACLGAEVGHDGCMSTVTCRRRRARWVQ